MPIPHPLRLFRRISLLAAAALLPALLPAQSLLERYATRLTPPPFYTCFKTAVPPVIDGRIDDPCWQQAGVIERLNDISGYDLPAPLYNTHVRMLWDDSCFYVSALLEEPYIRAAQKQRDDIVWHDNDFEVFIDAAGAGARYFEIEINALGTLLDLFMDKPYRTGGQFLSTWNCPGLRSAVHIEGTLNDSTYRDRYWSVEMAIPHEALRVGFDSGLRQGRLWRVNFSRVEWLKDGGPEENWVWAPTGEINIHMPERWGYVQLAEGATYDAIPREKAECTLLHALFYAQLDYHRTHQCYATSAAELGLAPTDAATLPASAAISVEGTAHTFHLSIATDSIYALDADGRLSISKLPER